MIMERKKKEKMVQKSRKFKEDGKQCSENIFIDAFKMSVYAVFTVLFSIIF